MKLLVIVLCLLSERYLVHQASFGRFALFSSYFRALGSQLPASFMAINPYALLAIMVLPLVILCAFVLWILGSIVFGFVGFLLHLVIFYYCLGPDNPFYPNRASAEDDNSSNNAHNYFVAINSQVFAVIFWYIVAGPVAALIYRLISLSQEQPAVASAAKTVTDILDWIPARITVVLYLLVGNFQQSVNFFMQHFVSPPQYNAQLLGEGGVLAARTQENAAVSLPYAQSLVEHAIILYLVFLAFFTFVAWL